MRDRTVKTLHVKQRLTGLLLGSAFAAAIVGCTSGTPSLTSTEDGKQARRKANTDSRLAANRKRRSAKRSDRDWQRRSFLPASMRRKRDDSRTRRSSTSDPFLAAEIRDRERKNAETSRRSARIVDRGERGRPGVVRIRPPKQTGDNRFVAGFDSHMRRMSDQRRRPETPRITPAPPRPRSNPFDPIARKKPAAAKPQTSGAETPSTGIPTIPDLPGEAAAPFPGTNVRTVSRVETASKSTETARKPVPTTTRHVETPESPRKSLFDSPFPKEARKTPAAVKPPVPDTPLETSPNPFAELPPATSQPVQNVPFTTTRTSKSTNGRAIGEADKSMIVDSDEVIGRRPATVLQRPVDVVPQKPQAERQPAKKTEPEIQIIPRRKTYRTRTLDHSAANHPAPTPGGKEIVQVAGEGRPTGVPFSGGAELEWKPVSHRRNVATVEADDPWQPKDAVKPPEEHPAPLPPSDARALTNAATGGSGDSVAVTVNELGLSGETHPAETAGGPSPLLLLIAAGAVLLLGALYVRRRKLSGL